MLLPYLAEHYGDVASVVGLFITFVGFGITIWNVRRAKFAAEEARRATQEAITRINIQWLANEVAVALQMVRDLDSACRRKEWPEALDRCDEARTRLAHIAENRGLGESDREFLSTSIDDIRDFMVEFQKHIGSVEPRPVPPRVGKRLHGIITTLSRIRGRIQAASMEA